MAERSAQGKSDYKEGGVMRRRKSIRKIVKFEASFIHSPARNIVLFLTVTCLADSGNSVDAVTREF